MNLSLTFPTTTPILVEELPPYFSNLEERIVPEILSPEGELNWGRLLCTWHEKQKSGQIVTHTYAASIDWKERGIYLDCRPRKIFAKCLAHLFTRPVFTVVKTAYHLSLYPTFKELAKSYHSTQLKEEAIKNIFKSLIDIVATPLYGTVLTITTLAVLILGCFNAESLYEGRKLLGKIEQLSNWGQVHTSWTLAGCFQPYSLDTLEHYGQKDLSQDTFYESVDPLDHQLANLARAHIVHKQRHLDVFSCSKLKLHAIYQSPILEF